MFPKEPGFICRGKACRKEFFIPEEHFTDGKIIKDIVCPECRKNTPGNPGKIVRFFKFYPRLVNAVDMMKTNGFELVSYGMVKHPMDTKLSISRLDFTCAECGKTVEVPVDQAYECAADPHRFYCRSCMVKPKTVKAVKEFFVSFKHVQAGFIFNREFQWDILRPLELPADLLFD